MSTEYFVPDDFRDKMDVKVKDFFPPRGCKISLPRTDIDRINTSGADLIWIGLGAPKQEQWMAAHEGRIHGVMLGVGAEFDFFAGTIQRAPKWMQKIGLEWLYRLFKDPKRLFRRYFVTNIKYMWYLLLSRMKRR